MMYDMSVCMSLSFSLSIVQSGRALNVYVYGYTSRNRSDPGDHTHIECVCIDPRYMYIFPDNHTTVDVYIYRAYQSVSGIWMDK